MTVTRQDIVDTARSHIGTPFRHQGREPGVWLDCIGHLICVCRKRGIVAPEFDINGYKARPDGTLVAGADQHMTRIRRHEMAPGHVVMLHWGREPQHFGILGDYKGGGLSIIHAFSHSDGKGKVQEERLEPLMKQFVAAFALPGVV